MPEYKGQTELVEEERRAFFANCWDRGEAPADDAWDGTYARRPTPI
jgi:hypothetical protein